MIEIPALLSREEVGRCRDALARAEWHDGRGTAGPVAAEVKQNLQLADHDPIGREIGGAILDRLAINPKFMAAALPVKILPPRFNKYTGAGAYGAHIDSAVFSVPGTPVRIRGDLSATLFLSEPEDYEGGDLVIQGEFSAQCVKLPAGHMILYPANRLHEVTPVMRGERLAAFFWIQSLVREASRRALLLDLDETIQSLTLKGQAGNEVLRAEILRLTGLYHNLLREWSET